MRVGDFNRNPVLLLTRVISRSLTAAVPLKLLARSSLRYCRALTSNCATTVTTLLLQLPPNPHMITQCVSED
jgi:hypothetical protein